MTLKQLLVFAFCAPTLQLVAQKHQIGVQMGTGLGNYSRPQNIVGYNTRENLDARVTYNFLFKRNFVIGSGIGFFQEAFLAPYFSFGDGLNPTNGFQYEKLRIRTSAISMPVSFGYRNEFKIKNISSYFSGNAELLFRQLIRSQSTRSDLYSDGSVNPNAGVTNSNVNQLNLIPKINVQFGVVLSERFDLYIGYGLGFGSLYRNKVQGEFYLEKFLMNSAFFGIRYNL